MMTSSVQSPDPQLSAPHAAAPWSLFSNSFSGGDERERFASPSFRCVNGSGATTFPIVSLQDSAMSNSLVVDDHHTGTVTTEDESSDHGGHCSSSSTEGESLLTTRRGSEKGRGRSAPKTLSSSTKKSMRIISPRRKGDKTERHHPRTVVEHKYHDHYHDSLAVVCGSSNNSGSGNCSLNNKYMIAKRPPGSARGGVTMAFPERLHEMLTTVEEEGLSRVISWQPHGRCFLIHQKKVFVEEVMPRFFHQSKLTSFQRQLNLYGFVRLTAGSDRGGYYHECFLRGRADLCRCMVRTRVKGNGMKAASSPETEPNFYRMEFCYDGHQEHFTGGDGSLSPSGNMIEEEGSMTTDDAADSNNMLMEEVGSVDMDDVSINNNSVSRSDPDEHLKEASDGLAILSSSSPSSSSSSSSSATMGVRTDLAPPIALPSSFATLVSPPASPNIRSKFTHKSATALLPGLVESTFMSSSFNGDAIPSLPSLPHSGDAVFFEGLKFRYMDHLDAFDLTAQEHRQDVSDGEEEISHGQVASV